MASDIGVELIRLTEQYGKVIDPDYVPVEASACVDCGDCCSDTVPFSKKEVRELKSEFPKLNDTVEVVSRPDGMFEMHTSDKKCFFYNEDGGCYIYEDRPAICRAYGASPLAKCGMEGYETSPDSHRREMLGADARMESFVNMMKVASILSK